MKALPVYLQWLILLACSLALGFILQYYHVPAALLLGPMVVGLVMALSGARIAISPKVFIGCQAILGCMIAGTLSPSILLVLVSDWLPVVLTPAVTLLASGLSGWLLVRFSRLPGPTGSWGVSPGGASAMAGDFGADVRLVAFMQYLRYCLSRPLPPQWRILRWANRGPSRRRCSDFRRWTFALSPR